MVPVLKHVVRWGGGPNKIWPVRVRWGGYKRRCVEEMGARGCRMAGQENVPGEAGLDASCIDGCLWEYGWIYNQMLRINLCRSVVVGSRAEESFAK